MPQRSGFTLVEIIVAASILGLMMVIGIPNFMTYRAKQSCSRAADIIMADIKLCKERAIVLDASRSTGVTTGLMPVSGASYDIYEIVMDANFAPAGIKSVRHVKLTSMGSSAEFALAPVSGYSTEYVDFYRRPEDDWAGMIVVASGRHSCFICIGLTPEGTRLPGHVEMKKNF